MSTKYPSAVVGKTKDVILSTTTIKMLETFASWRGNGVGDGYKEQLSTMLMTAVTWYWQYCEDFISNPELRAMALKTAEFTETFWMQLVSYLDEEYHLLLSFQLMEKHILLLLSNQIAQICNNVHAFRSTAASADVQNKAALAACFAWVSLQALGCMRGYLADKFRHHKAISGMFVRFLIHHMLDQSAIDLKSLLDSLQSKVKSISSDHKDKVTMDIFKNLYSKVERIVCLDPSLKTKD